MGESLRKRYSVYLQDVLSRSTGVLGPPSAECVHVGADSLPDLYPTQNHYIFDIPERLFKRFWPSVTERVYAAHIGADSSPDQYPTQNLKYQEKFYKRFGPPVAERAHAVHVGDTSPPDQPPT
ncbi:hypothetical protein B0H14DRAFT_3492190 [Mycena olivaceomarginata]|nr:hypothetical protein B0H14DRAFT_3492190 [Mycena olivaceomarginata]